MPRTTPSIRFHARQGWPAVLAIATGTFLMVTSEFLPIGLLGPMAGALHVSAGRAGLMVTMPGMVAALTAPLLTLLVGRHDRRLLLLMLTGLIMLADLVVAGASSLAAVLLGRVLLGLALGGFWAFSAAVGRRLVPQAQGHRAVALILGGISVGTVAGVPLGTLMGEMAGWRAAFGGAAALGGLVLLAQLALLPPLPGGAAPSPRDLVALLARPMARVGYGAAALVAGAHFAAYTYVEPLLATAGWQGGRALTLLLAAYGLAGVLGTWAGQRMAATGLLASFITTALTVAGAIALVALGAHHPWAVFLGMAVWGAGFGALPVCVQIWIYQADPPGFESGSALMVTVFQLAVAAGALLGGRLVDHAGLLPAFAAGSLLAALAALLLAGFGLARRGRRCQTPAGCAL
jgi:predicted MFS family arabinose efflux permease